MYVLLALVLCSLIAVFAQLSNRQKPPMSFMELSEFKDLPYELRNVVRKMLPDTQVIRQQWKGFTTEQKRMAIQQISQVMPQPPPPQQPAPSKGLKRGFLNPIHKNKKKNTENKKEDEVGALAVVGTPEVDGLTASNDSSFLGSDD